MKNQRADYLFSVSEHANLFLFTPLEVVCPDVLMDLLPGLRRCGEPPWRLYLF